MPRNLFYLKTKIVAMKGETKKKVNTNFQITDGAEK